MEDQQKKRRIRYREIKDPLEDVIAEYLSGVWARQPKEDDLIAAIDRKYERIQWDILYLKRQGYHPIQIMRMLHIGPISYQKSVEQLKRGGRWKEYLEKS